MAATSKDVSIDPNLKIGFIGAGDMAQAIIRGLLDTDTVRADNIMGSARRQGTLEKLKKLGIRVELQNVEVARWSDVIFIGVRPHQVSLVLREVAHVFRSGKLVVSLAAGITMATMKNSVQNALLAQGRSDGGRAFRLCRLMPNLSVAIGAGTSVVCPDRPPDGALVARLMASLGLVEVLDEEHMDVVSSILAPVYGAVAVDALADGCVKMGMPRDVAIRLAAQSLLGAAKQILSGQHPGAIKDEVCSPGGTTITALHSLEASGFRASLIAAIEAQTIRAGELGGKK